MRKRHVILSILINPVGTPRWDTSFRALQPSAGLPPPPPPPAPVVDLIPSLAPASIDALRTELLAAIRSEIATAPPPPVLLTEIAGIRSELAAIRACQETIRAQHAALVELHEREMSLALCYRSCVIGDDQYQRLD
ncbi:hypothetical protein RHMOL_Rhmol06G0276800 [Rhododendron molle]|uniref:Uncharacterized protein n=1 Tax=Rhododendron molle TaxID=49168 RepID=A0ACC0NH23_RHOML|nr:hypothetical protein RHMOL_Rhmol06G0276800 [Rhododendron molle]